MLAIAIFMAGHWQHFLNLLLYISPASMSSAAAAACVAAALWPAVAAKQRECKLSVSSMGQQVWAVVEGLILAIFKLPECARDINLAVQEIRDVSHTLKCIRAKIAFLPGTPKDENGVTIEPPASMLNRF